MKTKITIITAISLLPFVTSAASTSSLSDILTGFGGLLKLAEPIVFGLALLFFFYGVAKFIFAEGNVNSKNEGKSIMIYGVIALFVMVSILGIIKFINDNLAIQPQNLDGSNATIQYQGEQNP
jgi:hypothetical protein